MPRPELKWAFGRRPDLVIALSWIPVWIVVRLALPGGGAGTPHRLQAWVAFTLLLSFLHQPLTFGIVYGDRQQLAERRRFFLLAPLVIIAVLAVGFAGPSVDFTVVVTVGAIWNVVHIVQQRYGLARIYARKSGYGSARVDRALLYVSMAATIVAVAASPALPDLVRRAGLDTFNTRRLGLVTGLHPVALVLLVPALIALAGCLTLSVRQEIAAGPGANPARWLYLGSALALVGSIVVDPVAGFVAYIAAHAIEYVIVVWCTAERRYGPRRTSDRGGPLGLLGQTAAGRLVYFGGILALALFAYHAASGRIGITLVYAVGALHFLYDALIWKLRRPAVAAAFAVPAGPVRASASG